MRRPGLSVVACWSKNFYLKNAVLFVIIFYLFNHEWIEKVVVRQGCPHVFVISPRSFESECDARCFDTTS